VVMTLSREGSSGDLRRERHGSPSGERARELGQDRQVGVQLDALKSAHAKRPERLFVLEPAELAIYRVTAAVELAGPQLCAGSAGAAGRR